MDHETSATLKHCPACKTKLKCLTSRPDEYFVHRTYTCVRCHAQFASLELRISPGSNPREAFNNIQAGLALLHTHRNPSPADAENPSRAGE